MASLKDTWPEPQTLGDEHRTGGPSSLPHAAPTPEKAAVTAVENWQHGFGGVAPDVQT